VVTIRTHLFEKFIEFNALPEHLSYFYIRKDPPPQIISNIGSDERASSYKSLGVTGANNLCWDKQSRQRNMRQI
jgi:hypothetical protein